MGGNDKGLIELNGRPMIAHVIDGLKPQVETIMINANRNIEIYKNFGYDVLKDQLGDYQGPLAGFASGLEHCRTEYLVTAPCDGPFLSEDYVGRLHRAALDQNARISVAHDGQRLQPVYALIHASLLPTLLDFLSTGDRKIDRWYESAHYAKADFSDNHKMFTNVNTPEELTDVSQTLTD